MSAGFVVPLALFVLAYGAVAVFARRHPFLGRLAAREAIRRRGHSAVVVAGLMVGTATITAALVGADSVADSAVNAFAYRNWGNIDFTVSSTNRYFPASVAERIATSSEVRRLTDGVSAGVEVVGSVSNLDARQGASRVTLVGFDPAAQEPFGAFETTDGRRTFGADLGPGEVLVSRVLADKIDAAAGQRLRMTFAGPGEGPGPTVVRIAGVARSEGPGAYTLSSAVFAPLATAQRVVGTEQINLVRISAPGGASDSIDAARSAEPALQAAVGAVRSPAALSVRNAKGTEADNAREFTAFVRAMLLGMSALVMAAGAALIVNIVGMLAEERRSRLGVLRALGLTRRRLIGLSVTEGALYSLAAGVVGTGVGVGLGRIVSERFARAFAAFAGEEFDFTFFFSLKPATLVNGFAIGAFLTLAVVFFASRRTARMTVTAAIRDLPEPPPTKARRRWPRRIRLGVFSLLGLMGVAGGEAFPRMVGGMAVLLVAFSVLRARLTPRMHATLLGLGLAGWAFANIAGQAPEEDADAFFAVFVIAMLSAVFGLTTLAAAHLNLVERLVGLIGRSSGRLRVTLRPPLAYLARRPTRTGLTTGVFAVIIGMLTLFAVFIVIFRPDYVAYGNGYDVRVLSTGTTDISVPEGARADIVESVTLPARGYVGPVASEDDFSTSERTFMPLFETGPEFSGSPPVSLVQRSDDYASDAEAWAAVLSDPTLAVTNFTTPDMTITLRGSDGPVTFTAVGSQHFGLVDGLFASPRALEPFRDTPRGAAMLLEVRDETKARAVARAVESGLFEKGVDADAVSKLLDDADRANRAFFSTIDILMRMGLIVGILALGIVALRVVVERRHIIGVLRALGYRRKAVMGGLMAEATVTVAIGTVVGVVVGLVMGYLFYRQEESQPGFGIDVASIGGVLGIVFVAVMLVTIGPAWRASRLPPAEAVRYSE